MTETIQARDEKMMVREPQTIKRKIGRTIYEVSLHFSKTSSESMSDKVMRLLENDLSGMNFCGDLLYVLDISSEKAQSWSNVGRC